ncbi:hypothetical protein T8K17_25220 [Thalassobaculum sp. OXR-137]|nr:hypothetical protein [Thalassobaculum sp. OXR-137]WPZ34512.1 hypothetical protein T8K17_25220 [Thalassobaculum sp. OXR-137]
MSFGVLTFALPIGIEGFSVGIEGKGWARPQFRFWPFAPDHE